MMPRLALGFLLLAAAGQKTASAASNLRLPSTGVDAGVDARSFTVGGKRFLPLAGAVHYFRILPDDWRDRLLQTRLAGFNTVETPVPWNLHEPAKGQLHTEGAADLARFLDLCHELKLRALVRIGPYVNAAVTNGGLPAWLGDDPRLLVRSSNDRFIEAVRGYWGKLLPILVERQVPRGPVVMVQIEDHYQGPDERYLTRLYEEARDRGIRVPVVLSDLNPCKDFQRFRVLDTAVFATTELMPAQPLAWGDRPVPFSSFADVVFEGLAKGLDGYDHALWAAGTNLALLPACSFPTRYEASTCGLLDSGGLSHVFNDCKRVNWFARAFEGVLAEASAVSQHPLLDQAARTGLVTYGRSDGKTALLFFKRRYGEGKLPLADSATGESAVLPVSAAEFQHVVVNFPLTRATTLALSTAQILTSQEVGGRRLLVVLSPVGAEPIMVFRTEKKPAVQIGDDAFAWSETRKQLVLKWRCTDKALRRDFLFEADSPVHVVALEESQAAATWVLGEAGLLVGAPRVGPWIAGQKTTNVEVRVPARRIRYALTFYPNGPQRAVGKFKGLTDAKYDEKAKRIDFGIDLEIMEPIPIFIQRWEMADAAAEAAPGYNDADWRASTRGEPLGEDRYGWYRCRFRAARAAQQKLFFENVADVVTVYLNGQFVGQSAMRRLVDSPSGYRHPATFDVAVKAGENVLAVFAKNWGRYRNTSSYGIPLAPMTGWGLLGSVLLDGKPLLNWRQREGMAPSARSLAWGPAKDQPGALRWHKTAFRLHPHAARLAARLRFKGPSYGSAWLNGHYVGLYNQQGYDAAQGLHLPAQWLAEQNELILLEEGGRLPAEAEVRFDRTATYVPLMIEFQ